MLLQLHHSFFLHLKSFGLNLDMQLLGWSLQDTSQLGCLEQLGLSLTDFRLHGILSHIYLGWVRFTRTYLVVADSLP